MTYYRITKYGSVILPVEFERVTEHYGHYAKRTDGLLKEKLVTSYWEYLPTREEAVAKLYTWMRNDAAYMREQADKAEQKLYEFMEREGMPECS